MPVVRYPQGNRGGRPPQGQPPPAQANAIIIEVVEQVTVEAPSQNQESFDTACRDQNLQKVDGV